MSVPEYRLLQDTFFAPKMVYAGSTVKTHGPPGPHLQPLNAAAHEAMEAWYNEEHPTVDKHGEPDHSKMYKPHAKYRVVHSAPGSLHEVEVLAEPPKDLTGELSLAQSVYTRQDTDQRPGPALVHVAEAMAEQSGAAVVEEVEKPADVRKAGIKVS